MSSLHTVSKYWRLVALNAAGRKVIHPIEVIQAHLTKLATQGLEVNRGEDSQIQRHLWQQAGDRHAIGSLRCWISWQIEWTCRQLALQFGERHGFRCEDLLPFVLVDDRHMVIRDPFPVESPDLPESDLPESDLPESDLTPLDLPQPDLTSPDLPQPERSRYRPLSLEILADFDPDRSSLATWTTRKVKHHSELNGFLLQCGLYLVSDWAILNDTRLPQLARILGDRHQRTPTEIAAAEALLASYHAVYRYDRRQVRKQGAGSRCQPPTEEQLQRMAAQLAGQPSPRRVLADLQALASELRHYRIEARGGNLPLESLDRVDETGRSLGDRLPATDEISTASLEQETFLERYRERAVADLDAAIALAIEQRWQRLGRKSATKAEQFLIALRAFHCEGVAMGDIASRVDLQAQYQVTRLLDLKGLRAETRHHWLQKLRTSVQELAQTLSCVEDWTTLDQRLDVALNAEVDRTIQEAEAEASTPKSRATTSLFARRVCWYLDQR
jgi:hypothetical protein